MRRAMTLGLLVSLWGCAPELVPGRYGCETDSECPDEWVCGFDERCYPRGQDPDGGRPPEPVDAGPEPVDAGPEPVDGGPDAGPPCEPRPVNVDLLLMIDQSGSMSEAQDLLKESVSELVDLVVTRDLDGDDIADFPEVDSLHIGVVTSDMGAYSSTVVTCAEPAGDDGILLSQSFGGDPTCDGSFDPVQVYEGGPGQAEYIRRVQCLADVGPMGCGYEQQLHAVLKAVTPSGSDVRFFDGAPGHGDVANMGFLREDSVLVTLIVSDENDCSTHNADLFVDRDMYPAASLNQLCGLYEEALLPTSRFSDGLLDLRDDPADLIFGAIIGVPTDAATRSPSAILEDARMTVNYTGSNARPDPVCVRGLRQGDPGRRYVEVARDIADEGGSVAIRSICEENFEGMSLDLMQRLAPRLRARSCEPEPME